jgi:hypothetical protein
MKNLCLLVLFVFSIVLLASCSDSESTLIGNPDGVFNGKITIYDSVGVIQQVGEINLIQTNSTDLNGNWKFSDSYRGKLVGTISGDKVELNLNPEFIDNNTILIGTFDGKTISGDWMQIGIMGVFYEGTFVAKSY